MTLVKTSYGGFNLEQVTNWTMSLSDDCLDIWFAAPNNDASDGQERCRLMGEEARRALAILEGVCIFDTTRESA